MERKVFCVIGERCKAIKFVKSDKKSDVEAIREGLMLACLKDNVLQSMISGKGVVLQRKDPDRNDRLCDIDEDDDVEEKEDVHVVLIDLQPNKSTVNLSEALATGSTVTFDVPVLQVYDAEKFDGEIEDKKCPDHGPVPVIMESTLDVKEDTTKNEDLPEMSTESVPATKRRKPNLTSGNTNISTAEARASYLGMPGSVTYPAPLPKLTTELDNIRSTVGLLLNERSFVNFWSVHLQQLTGGCPSKGDYLNYAKTIVDTYPELKAGKLGYGAIKKDLSICIRNRKANLKKKMCKITGSSQTKKSALIVQNICESTTTDIAAALKELQKPSNHCDTAHVRRLMRETLSTRRSWIKDDAKGIREIIEKYPQLMDYNLILSELEIMKSKSLEILHQKIDALLHKLIFYFEKVDSDTTEESKCLALCKLQEKFNGKQKKSVTPLFVVKKALSSTENLVTGENESPRGVLYTAEGGITAAFIVADTLRTRIPEPTVGKMLVCLLAAYYVWDTSYPSAYQSVMQYIDLEVLGTPNTKTCVDKFVRDVANALNKKGGINK